MNRGIIDLIRGFFAPVFSILSLGLLLVAIFKRLEEPAWLFSLWGPVQVAIHVISGPVNALTIAFIGSLFGLLFILFNITQWAPAVSYLINVIWLWVAFWWVEKLSSRYRQVIQASRENQEHLERDITGKEAELAEAKQALNGLKTRGENYARLREFVDALAAILSVDQLSQHVKSSLEKFLGPGQADIIIFDKNGTVSKPDSLSNWMYNNPRPLLIRDLKRSPHGHWSPQPQESISLVVSPLFLEKKVVGFLYKYSDPTHAFDEADLRFLATVADLTALALANIQLFAEVEALASEDMLTGLYVRYRFDEKLEELFAVSQGANIPLCMVMFDVDYFKNINDQYGHQAGDFVLKGIAQIVRKNCRDTDFATRYGGEEIAVIMPHTKIKDANIFAERVRAAVNAAPFKYGDLEIRATVSAGTASLNPHMTNSQQFLEDVDSALYMAKAEGRNRIATSRRSTGEVAAS